MKKYVLVACKDIKQWSFMTKENYKARISNVMDMCKFEGYNGFKSTEDVLAYVETYFKISRNDIEII